jgi:hypothetical protein
LTPLEILEVGRDRRGFAGIYRLRSSFGIQNHHLFGIQYRLMPSGQFACQKLDCRPVLNKFGGFARVIGY